MPGRADGRIDVVVDDQAWPDQVVRFDRGYDDPIRLALGEDRRYHGVLRSPGDR